MFERQSKQSGVFNRQTWISANKSIHDEVKPGRNQNYDIKENLLSSHRKSAPDLQSLCADSVRTLNLATIDHQPSKMIGGFNPSQFSLNSKYQFKSQDKQNSREYTLSLLKQTDEQERLKRYQEMLATRQSNTNYWQKKSSQSVTNASS